MKRYMLAFTSTALAVAAVLWAAGLAAESTSPDDAPSAPASRRAPVDAAAQAVDLSVSEFGSGVSCEAEQKLAMLDARVGVPLLPHMANHQKQNMRDHLLAVQEIVTAAAIDDFSAIELAAARIGYSEEMGQMCNQMGAGVTGFTEQALHFHRSADGIAAAARKRDSAAVLQALGRTLSTCTACHATYRQSVVDPAAWKALTTKAAPGTAPAP